MHNRFATINGLITRKVHEIGPCNDPSPICHTVTVTNCHCHILSCVFKG